MVPGPAWQGARHREATEQKGASQEQCVPRGSGCTSLTGGPLKIQISRLCLRPTNAVPGVLQAQDHGFLTSSQGDSEGPSLDF